ncbi:hypothetical protein ABID60_008052 [Bradyrhizobium sp. S3.5.5]
MMRSMLCRREPYRSLSHRRPRAVPQPVMEHRWSPISLCSRALISSTTPTGSRSQQINDRGWRSSEQAANLLRLSAAARAIFRSRNLWGSRSCRPRWNNAIASGVTCTLLLRRLFFRVRSGISAVVLTCSKPTVARSGLGRSDSGLLKKRAPKPLPRGARFFAIGATVVIQRNSRPSQIGKAVMSGLKHLVPILGSGNRAMLILLGAWRHYPPRAARSLLPRRQPRLRPCPQHSHIRDRWRYIARHARRIGSLVQQRQIALPPRPPVSRHCGRSGSSNVA